MLLHLLDNFRKEFRKILFCKENVSSKSKTINTEMTNQISNNNRLKISNTKIINTNSINNDLNHIRLSYDEEVHSLNI